jgi:predicted SAM-dependent methyltransferase
MNRYEKATKFLNLEGAGLEIGPSYNPIVRKSSGADIKILDHTDRAGLLKKYYWMPEETINSIEEVDYIWTGGSLVDVIGKEMTFDYIIASHFIEHTTDIIGFLKDCERLLKKDGVFSLIIPDKRYCFDRFKAMTTIGAALDVHLNHPRFHTPGTVLDHLAYSVVRDGGKMAWTEECDEKMTIEHPNIASQMDILKKAIRQDEYIDVHHWIFTPASFSLFIQDLFDIGYNAFYEIGGFETAEFEFYISLSRNGKHVNRLDRFEMLNKIESELCSINVKKKVKEKKCKKARELVKSISRSLRELMIINFLPGR